MAKEKSTQLKTDTQESLQIGLQTRDCKPYFDQPENTFAQHPGSNPLDHQLYSLAGCVSTIGRIVAKRQNIALRELTCEVENEQHARKSNIHPGSKEITLVVNVDADMTPEQKEAFIHEVDKRCLVSDTFTTASALKYVIK